MGVALEQPDLVALCRKREGLSPRIDSLGAVIVDEGSGDCKAVRAGGGYLERAVIGSGSSIPGDGNDVAG